MKKRNAKAVLISICIAIFLFAGVTAYLNYKHFNEIKSRIRKQINISYVIKKTDLKQYYEETEQDFEQIIQFLEADTYFNEQWKFTFSLHSMEIFNERFGFYSTMPLDKINYELDEYCDLEERVSTISLSLYYYEFDDLIHRVINKRYISTSDKERFHYILAGLGAERFDQESILKKLQELGIKLND